MALVDVHQLAARVAGAADFGHCLECGDPIPFDEAIAGRVMCPPCDVELEAFELEIAGRRDQLAGRIIAECSSWHHWSEARDVRGQLDLPLAA